MIDGKTKLYGIIGNPVEHSLSPVMHNAAFTALGLNGVYLPMQPTDLARGFQGLAALGFVGVSVTIPFKIEVMSLVDRIDPVAEKIGAVNTLHFQSHNGTICCIGSNTDWQGANLALAETIALHGRRALILGAGGAARAVGFGLLEAGAKPIITNRTQAKGKALADHLGCPFVPADQLKAIQADILINTTSVGMTPQENDLPITPELLPRFQVVMDIVYAPLETRLLRKAAACGCRTVDGLKMLQYQGSAQFQLWTNQDPPHAVMRNALLTELQNRTN